MFPSIEIRTFDVGNPAYYEALGNLEEKFKTARIPILFFSARKCDEPLKKQMALFSPAVYLNKGSDTDPEILLERVDQLMSYILRKSASPSAE